MVTELPKQSATVSRVGPWVECAHMETVGYCSLPQRGTQDDSFFGVVSLFTKIKSHLSVVTFFLSLNI